MEMRFFKLSRLLALTAGLVTLSGLAQAQSDSGTIATATPFDWSASTIPNYASASGVISAGDVDFFQFQVFQGGFVDFGLPGGSSFSLVSPRIDLFDPSGALVGGADGRFYSLMLDPGVYFPRISSSANGAGTYNFTVSGASPFSEGTAQIGGVRAAVPETGTLSLLGVGCLAAGAAALSARRRQAV